ncbi:MAG: nuclear transport factor 2 family protein [Proteobacteria bacterium]|nr:nuclear transport factor 2 family protein [Pseudomonadota bacterium]
MTAATDQVLKLIDGFNTMNMDAILGCFADGAVYHNIPMQPVIGHDAISATLAGFMSASTEVVWELVHVAENNGVVLTERVDKFKINGTWIALPVMGTFEVSDAGITEWRDYFDLADFQSQFAAAVGG